MKELDELNSQTEDTMSQKVLSFDEKQMRIPHQTAGLPTDAEAEIECFEERMKFAFQAQEEVKNKMLAKHEEERMRLEQKMQIDIAEWVVLEKQMHDDVGEFEAKIKIAREQRLFDLVKEEQKMAEASRTTETCSEIERKALIDNQEAKLKQMSEDEKIRKEKEEETLR